MKWRIKDINITSNFSIFHKLHGLPKNISKITQKATLLFFFNLRLWRCLLQLHQADRINVWWNDLKYLQRSTIELLQIRVQLKVYQIWRVSETLNWIQYFFFSTETKFIVHFDSNVANKLKWTKNSTEALRKQLKQTFTRLFTLHAFN